MEFRTGDVVRLKSGGPKMTVIRIKESDVWCNWFLVDQDVPKMHSFKPEMLEKVEKRAPSMPEVIRVGG